MRHFILKGLTCISLAGIIVSAIGIAGCGGTKSITNTVKDSTHVSETTQNRDTTIKVAGSKAIDNFTVPGTTNTILSDTLRDGINFITRQFFKGTARNVTKSGQAKNILDISGNAKLGYHITDSCICDSMAIMAVLKDKIINEYKSHETTQTITKIVPTHFWYDTISYIAAIILFLEIIVVIIYLYLKLKP